MDGIYVTVFSPQKMENESYRLIVVDSKETYDDIHSGRKKYGAILAKIFPNETIVYAYKGVDRIVSDVVNTRIDVNKLITDQSLNEIPVYA